MAGFDPAHSRLSTPVLLELQSFLPNVHAARRPDISKRGFCPTQPVSSLAGLSRAFTTLMTPSERHRQISEIAYDWGFKSEAHFSRAFRSAFGLTPRDAQSMAFAKPGRRARIDVDRARPQKMGKRPPCCESCSRRFAGFSKSARSLLPESLIYFRQS
jgi:AraC-like DNA-binding protein